jgi:hypothetical protein
LLGRSFGPGKTYPKRNKARFAFKISASRFELKNFPAGNLNSWTGFSIALQARANLAKQLPEAIGGCPALKISGEQMPCSQDIYSEGASDEGANTSKMEPNEICNPTHTGQPKTAKEIRIMGRGMVISTRASGVICACDGLHRILRVRLEGGVIAELLQERTDNKAAAGQYRDQMLIVKNGKNATIIDF